jgi:hypothetical protein
MFALASDTFIAGSHINRGSAKQYGRKWKYPMRAHAMHLTAVKRDHIQLGHWSSGMSLCLSSEAEV